MMKRIFISILFFSFIVSESSFAAQARIISDPHSALVERVESFRRAKSEIFLAMFIYNDDFAGNYLLSVFAQLKKENPNLSIKILVDSRF